MADVPPPGLTTNIYASSVGAANMFGANMNIPEMIMALQLERSNILDDQIKGQMEDMQKRNEWLKKANEALAELRTNRPQSQDHDAVDYGEVVRHARLVVDTRNATRAVKRGRSKIVLA